MNQETRHRDAMSFMLGFIACMEWGHIWLESPFFFLLRHLMTSRNSH